MKTGIYLIRNKVSGKCYVGQSMDIEARWKQHIISSKKPEFPIHKAIAKYGVENFEFLVIEECSADQLNEREIHWIDFYKSFGKNGYNCTLGGGGSNQGKDSYSAEYKRATSNAWNKAHPEYKRAASNAWNKAHPEYNRATSKAFYEAHKDDHEFKEKNRERDKAWYEENKDDPEFKKKKSARNKAYYESHKFTPDTQDHTEMPLW